MSSDVINYAFRCAPGEGQLLPMIGRLKVSSAQTGGAFEVIDYEGPAVPPPHVHRDRDECFCIIEGLFTFILGTEEVEAPADSIVFVRRGTRHAFKPSEGARALLFVIPAGLEGFFRELGEGLVAGRSSADLRAALAGKYDSEPVE
jgi:mannose-6-phosphate isomerase-like protein (cupin superfamily)